MSRLLVRKRHVLAATQLVASSTYQSKVVADGASNYWRLNETSGTTAVDNVGGKNATIGIGVTLGQTGPLSDGAKAMSFDGTFTPKITTIGTINLPAVASIEVWFKSSTKGSDHSICSTSVATGTGIYEHPSGAFGCSDHFAFGVNGTTDISNGLWHHGVATWDGTTVRIYVDGILEGSAAWARGNIINTQFYIGTFVDNQQTWLGSIAEVAIYPVALTLAQIASHYAAR